MSTHPPNFQVRYAWHEGSAPPPYYYEYEIHIGPGPEGRILFRPGYPLDEPPTWTRSFFARPEALDALYAMTVEDESWLKPDLEAASHLGGPQMQLVVIVQGQRREAWAYGPDSALERVGRYVTSLVPDSIWGDLWTRRDAYMRAH
ncbi:MAG: hypothetical protein GXP42_15080 [Chloroflexi bacterium]|nr:hypothetical protein [Chloroflexota bacterium]